MFINPGVLRYIVRIIICLPMKSLNIHNMKRVAASALAMAAVAAPALGETVSQKEALRLAQTFFNAANGQVMGKPNLVYNGKHLTTDKLFLHFMSITCRRGICYNLSREQGYADFGI